MNIVILLKGLLDKSNYNRYRHRITILPEEKPTYDLLDQAHSLSEDDISIDDLLTLAGDEHPSLPVLIKLTQIEVNESILQEAIKTHFERVWALEQASLFLKVSEGKIPLSEAFITSSYEEVSEESQPQQENDIVSDDLEEIVKEIDRSGGLQWRLPSLQEHIGGLHTGDFVIVTARPESGKTTFLASEAGYMATNVPKDHPVLWFNNEERGVKVMSRIYQGVLGQTYEELLSNPVGNKQKFRQQANIILIDKGYITRRDVERYTKQFQPSLIVLDQLDKVKGFKADREDLVLGAIYQWARELAKEWCPVISVTQASASGENKRWLTMDDLAGSKTSKAAEGDVIIGIGKSDEGHELARYIHLIKNKITGSHAKLTTLIIPERARYRDV